MIAYFFAYVIALKVHALKIKVTVDLEKRLCNVIMLILFHKLFKNFRPGDICLIIFLFLVFPHLNLLRSRPTLLPYSHQ